MFTSRSKNSSCSFSLLVMYKKIFYLCLLLLFTGIPARSLAMTTYNYTELLPWGWSEAHAVAINKWGAIVGNGVDSSGKHVGFYTSSGLGYGVILPPGWSFARVQGISDLGYIVGDGINANGDGRGFLDIGGSYYEILPPGWWDAMALGVNKDGVIVGSGSKYAVLRGFILSGGVYTELLPPGAGWLQAEFINNNGVVAGTVHIDGVQKAFIYDGGTYTMLVPPGWSQARAKGINDNGDVVLEGFDELPDTTSPYHNGFVYSGGVYTAISQNAYGWHNTWVDDINNIGGVVGSGYFGGGYSGPVGAFGGFVYQGGAYTAILPSGWDYAIPSGINDDGVIVGSGRSKIGDNWFTKGFIAKPVINNEPVANAGPAQTVHVGSLVTLDGSGSSDPDGNVPLTYAWSFQSRPAGSSVSLANPTSVNPTFTPDVSGNYVVQLIVTDSLGAVSQPATVTISTTNTAPVAEAGPDQAVTAIGATVQLDGSQSYDPDGDTIGYQWSLSVPEGSAAKLNNANTASPTFIADVHGTYVAQLVVSDPWTQSASDTVTISFTNVKPLANAGLSQSAIVGDTVTLNGSGSTDANGDALTYQWSFTSVPAGSLSAISFPTAAITTFVPDVLGTYVAQLVVNDGYVNSDPSTVQVQVVTAQTAAVQETQNIQTIITSLDTSVLKNTTMQNALCNKLNAVLANIAAGNYGSALNQLQNDILLKTDGCAKNGSPDQNDWINSCPEQQQVYSYVMQLIQLLQSMK